MFLPVLLFLSSLLHFPSAAVGTTTWTGPNATDICYVSDHNFQCRSMNFTEFPDVSSVLSAHILSLDENKITKLPPLAALVNLTDLYLSHNLITTIPPYTFNGMESLQVLDMGENALGYLEATMLSGAPRLETIYFPSNPIEWIDAESFKGIDGLKLLDLSQTRIPYLQEGIFDGLENLLIFNANNVTTLLGMPKDLLKSSVLVEELAVDGGSMRCDIEKVYANGTRYDKFECMCMNHSKYPIICEVDGYFCCGPASVDKCSCPGFNPTNPTTTANPTSTTYDSTTYREPNAKGNGGFPVAAVAGTITILLISGCMIAFVMVKKARAAGTKYSPLGNTSVSAVYVDEEEKEEED